MMSLYPVCTGKASLAYTETGIRFVTYHHIFVNPFPCSSSRRGKDAALCDVPTGKT